MTDKRHTDRLLSSRTRPAKSLSLEGSVLLSLSIWVWLLLVVGALLLVLLGVGLLRPGGARRAAAQQQRTPALGMQEYFSRPPFDLFVATNFPDNESFRFIDNTTLLTLVANDKRKERRGSMEASMSIGTNFLLVCRYMPGSLSLPTEYYLVFKSFSVIDLNCDGVMDERATRQPVQRFDVWLDGKWAEVDSNQKDGAGKYRRCLLSGNWVVFDRERGNWSAEASTNGAR